MAFLPKLTVNSSGWGPVEDIENIFPALPYAQFSKNDKFGKAADWTATNRHPARPGTSVSTVFNAFEEDDEEDYSIVDTRPQKKPFTRGRAFVKPTKVRQVARVRGGQNWQQQTKGRPTRQKKGQAKYYQNQGKKYNNYNTRSGSKAFSPSIEVLPNWGDAVHSIELNALSALERITPPDGVTLVSCGRLEKYNGEIYDKVSVRHERPLEKNIERVKHQVTTKEDPTMKILISQSTGNVYATDAILSVLMCSTKSVYSWDVLLQKRGDTLIFDKRDGYFDYLTVNENATEPPIEEEAATNNVVKLHEEATYLNISFSQQLLLKDEDKVVRFEKNPFIPGSDHGSASVAYFYRKWDLGDGINLVARTEVDGYKSEPGKDKPSFLIIKALNEFDPKVTGWRSKLESQKAGCFATEVKNNSNKLAKWAVQCSLAGADELKLGYVTRVNPRDSLNHAILAITSIKPSEYCREIGVDVGKLWATLKQLLMEFRKLEDGEYVIMREGNKKQLLVYKTDTEAQPV